MKAETKKAEVEDIQKDQLAQKELNDIDDLMDGTKSPEQKHAVNYSKDHSSPTNKSAMTAEKTNTSPLSLLQDTKQTNHVSVARATTITSTSINLTKRFVKANESTNTYQQALKREELQTHHDAQHNDNEKNLIEVQ